MSNSDGATPRSSSGLHREEVYPQFAREELEPFFDSLEQKVFLGRNGVSLRYIHVNAAERGDRCVVVVVPGRTESFFKYAETIWDLSRAGHEVFAYDHRGQGYSERLLADPQVGYVREFDDYVADLKTFLSMIVAKEKQAQKVFLLAHSMGGAVALKLQQRLQAAAPLPTPLFDGLALSAPMLEISLEHPSFLVEAVVSVRCLMGQGQKYASLPGPFDAATYGADLTSSDERLKWYRSSLSARPEIQLGMPSNQWMKEALRASSGLRRWLSEEGINLPVFLIAPGKDSVVNTERQELLRRHHKGVLLESVSLPFAKHDALIETDDIRAKVIESLLSFLEHFDSPAPPLPHHAEEDPSHDPM